ncbi:MAG: ABC transporter substrate-binding protein [Gemmatimonadaceae bacterium]|nr:ABC transporter substrate-binding protein [Gemmatimonadaceae bacterium]
MSNTTPRRVVSLLPAATEIVALLGASDALVGITHECDYPDIVGSRARVTRSNIPSHPLSGDDATQHHAGVGTHSDPATIDAAVRELSHGGLPLFALDEARIRALHPDVLLTQALCDVCAVSEHDVRALAAALSPTPSVVTLGGNTIEGIFSDIERVAAALHAESEAEELLAGLRARITHVHDTLKAARAPRPRAALIEWTSPVYLAGHWGPEQIKRAGGIDTLGTAGAHSVTVHISALTASEPEFVFIAPCGYSLSAAATEAEQLLRHADWQWLAGKQVWALDANGLVSRPGPRVVDGIEAMARVMNPQLFTALDPHHAKRVQ